MSAVVETLRKWTGRSSDVMERLEGLGTAVDAARGRLDPQLVDDADALVVRAASRLRLSSEHTVVALAGATGSGKSSLFNALCGLDLAAVGVKRPTTSWALACAWGPVGAADILDWLGIPKRHQLSRTGLLDETAADRDLQGLVLLDLPDHDSTEVSHHLEVERLVQYADVLLWVLDPQKYADAAIHDRFLRPLSTHADIMMVALNHVDEIPESAVGACLSDIDRLLVLDGLKGVPVFATSATRGDGLDRLHDALAARVSKKQVAKQRLTADVRAMALRLSAETGDIPAGDVRLSGRDELLQACAGAAGVPVIVEAVESASFLRARRATGWPVTSWLTRFRRDPLSRFQLASSGSATGTASVLGAGQTAVSAPNSVQRARVDSAVRSVVDDVTAGMKSPWQAAVRAASLSRLDDFAHALGHAVSTTDLGVARNPRWWGAVRVLQWILFVTALVGGGWLVVLGGLSYLRLSQPATPEAGGVALPTVLLLGGVIAGLALALVSRVVARSSARRHAQRADARLRKQVERVTDDLVIAPIQVELESYDRCRDGLQVALAR